jgi:hypothetical protein
MLVGVRDNVAAWLLIAGFVGGADLGRPGALHHPISRALRGFSRRPLGARSTSSAAPLWGRLEAGIRRCPKSCSWSRRPTAEAAVGAPELAPRKMYG